MELSYRSATSEDSEFYLNLYDQIRSKSDIAYPNLMKAKVETAYQQTYTYSTFIHGVFHVAKSNLLLVEIFIKNTSGKLIPLYIINPRLASQDFIHAKLAVPQDSYYNLLKSIVEGNKRKEELTEIENALIELGNKHLVLSKELNTLTKDMQKLTKRKSELC
jgi:hypothetical protein